MRYILIFLSLPFLIQSQTNVDIGVPLDYEMQLIQREIAAVYNPKTTNFTGNKYFYKSPKDAIIVLTNDNEKIKALKVKTNYNLLEQTFDVILDDKTLKLLPDKIEKVTFNDRVFLSVNDKFYELIEQNLNFSLLADTFLEAYIPEYQPGIQEKPDPRYRKSNSVFLYYNDRFTYIERRKNFLISMFQKSKSKEINTFYKKNKISPRDDNELKELFIQFFDFLSL